MESFRWTTGRKGLAVTAFRRPDSAPTPGAGHEGRTEQHRRDQIRSRGRVARPGWTPPLCVGSKAPALWMDALAMNFTPASTNGTVMSWIRELAAFPKLPERDIEGTRHENALEIQDVESQSASCNPSRCLDFVRSCFLNRRPARAATPSRTKYSARRTSPLSSTRQDRPATTRDIRLPLSAWITCDSGKLC
jgi:hypothetical protein